MYIFNYGTLVDPLLKDVRKTVAQFSGMNPGDSVLDVCCGTGTQVFEYGRRGIIATGIDISPEMFRTASRKQRKQGQEKVSFYLGDATDLPFADSSFDCACVSFGLHDKEKEIRYRIVSEMKRVVKQHGVLVFVDFKVPLPQNAWGRLARTVEFMVGGVHYQGFKDYLRRGGLEDVISVCHLRQDHVSNLKNGLVNIIKARVA